MKSMPQSCSVQLSILQHLSFSCFQVAGTWVCLTCLSEATAEHSAATAEVQKLHDANGFPGLF